MFAEEFEKVSGVGKSVGKAVSKAVLGTRKAVIGAGKGVNRAINTGLKHPGVLARHWIGIFKRKTAQ